MQVYDPCLARAGAEMMAAAACIGSATLALGQVGCCCSALQPVLVVAVLSVTPYGCWRPVEVDASMALHPGT
jgi:hypothetical protein